MPRNGSGIYSLPSGYLAEAGELIIADQHNDPLEDIKDDLNAARPVVAGGTGSTTASGARSNLSVYSQAESNASYVKRVTTKTALKALDTASYKSAFLEEAGVQKMFAYTLGDFTAATAGDPSELSYIPADGIAVSIGCWVAVTGAGASVVPVISGGTGSANAADARTALGLEIGTDIQAYDADLSAIAALAKTDGNVIVGNGATWVAESGATARTSLGLTIGTDVQAYSANLDEFAGVNPTTAGLALLDDADAAAQRTTLELGGAATLDAPDNDDLSVGGTSVALRKNVKAYVDANIVLPALAANTFLVTNAAATARENKPFADVRDLLDTAPYVATRTALKALDTTKESVAFLSESGREGWFVWKAGNYAAAHSTDTQEGVYVKATAIASSAGSWVRVFDHEIMPEWFGAVGDYSADDYTALNAAVIFAKTYSVPLLLTGEYRINTTLACGSINGITEKLTIRGKGTIAGAVSGAVMTIGNASATSFTGYVTLEDITIAKYTGYSPSEGLVLIDVVRSKFIRLTTEGLGDGIGVLMKGGVALSFDNCSFDWNAIGLKIMKFTSLAGGGYPNLISIRNSLIINNSVYGLEFSSGRHLIIDGCDIEGNGNSDAGWKGGVIINSNIGEESSLSFALGLTITNCWFEANSGGSALVLFGGTNTVRDCYFVANSGATYDIYIGGGRHRIHGTQHDTNKTTHIIREGSAGSANVIENARKADGGVANITLP